MQRQSKGSPKATEKRCKCIAFLINSFIPFLSNGSFSVWSSSRAIARLFLPQGKIIQGQAATKQCPEMPRGFWQQVGSSGEPSSSRNDDDNAFSVGFGLLNDAWCALCTGNAANLAENAWRPAPSTHSRWTMASHRRLEASATAGQEATEQDLQTIAIGAGL